MRKTISVLLLLAAALSARAQMQGIPYDLPKHWHDTAKISPETKAWVDHYLDSLNVVQDIETYETSLKRLLDTSIHVYGVGNLSDPTNNFEWKRRHDDAIIDAYGHLHDLYRKRDKMDNLDQPIKQDEGVRKL